MGQGREARRLADDPWARGFGCTVGFVAVPPGEGWGPLRRRARPHRRCRPGRRGRRSCPRYTTSPGGASVGRAQGRDGAGLGCRGGCILSAASRCRGEITSRWSRHSSRTVRTNRSANAFALGEATGGWMVSMPTEASTASKLEVYLVSGSRMRNRKGRPASWRSAAKLPPTWATHGAVGVGGNAKQVHDSTLDLDHEQDVAAPERHGIDGEEVGGQDALGLCLEELAARRAAAPGRGWEVVAAQDGGDAGLRHGDTEFFELRRCAGSPSWGSPWPGPGPIGRSLPAAMAGRPCGGDRSNAVGGGHDASQGLSQA